MFGRRSRSLLALAAVTGLVIAAAPAHAAVTFGLPSRQADGVAAPHRVMATGDVSGDGFVDIVFLKGPDLVLLRGEGDGTFRRPLTFATGLTDPAPAMASGDLDGNGLPDTVQVQDGELQGAYTILLADGADGFVAVGGPLPPGPGLFPHLADVDGDADLDLVFAGQGLAVVLNQAGVFGAWTSFRPSASMVTPHALAVADVDGDGREDLLTTPLAGQDEGLSIAFMGTDIVGGPARPGIEVVVHVATEMRAGSAVATGDFDGDGDLDIAVHGLLVADGTPATRVLRNDGARTFTPMSVAKTRDRSQTGVLDLGVADFDQDGALDLILGCGDDVNCRVLLLHHGDGAAGLELAVPVPVLNNALRLELADVDCDGDTDVVGGGDLAVVALNQGGRAWLDEATVLITADDMALADFDGDGQLDLAALAAEGLQTAPGTGCTGPTDPCSGPLPTVEAGEDVQACADPGDVATVVVAASSISPLVRYCWQTNFGVFEDTLLPFTCSTNPTARLRLPASLGRNVATLTVTGTDIDACRGTDQVEVIAETPPIITLAAASESVACEGAAINYRARASDTFSSRNLVTFTWDFDLDVDTSGNGIRDDDVDATIVALSGGTTVVAGPMLAPGTHVARVTAVGESSECLATAETTVEILAPPVVTGLTGTSSTCAATPAVFQAAPRGGVEPISLLWDFDTARDADGDGDPANDVQATGELVEWTFGTGGDRTVRVRALDANGCVGFQERTVQVFQQPVAAFTSTSPACEELAISFTDTSTGTPPLAVTWDFGDGTPIIAAQDPTHVYPAPGAYTVVQSVTDGTGCTTLRSAIVHVRASALRLVGQAVLDGGDTGGGNGNGNGFAEPGELIGLPLDVSNTGTETAVDVRATVTVASPASGVTILRPTALFPSIEPDTIETSNAPPVEILLDADFPCGASILLDVAVMGFGSEGCSATQRVVLPTGLPGLAPLDADRRLTTADGAAVAPSSAFGQAQHLTAFVVETFEGAQVYLARQSRTGGLPSETPRNVSLSDGEASQPRLAWNANLRQFGLAWHETSEGGDRAVFALLSPAGTIVGGPYRFTLTGRALPPDVTWTGSEWVVAWPEVTDEGTVAVHAHQVSADGLLLSPPLLVSPAADLGAADHARVRLASAGGTWTALTVRRADGNVTLTTRTFAGGAAASLTPLATASHGAAPDEPAAIAASSSGYLVAHRSADGEVVVTGLTLAGLARFVEAVGAGIHPALAIGPELAVVTYTSGDEIVARGITRSGAVFGPEVVVSGGTGPSVTSTVSADDAGFFLVAWSDRRTAHPLPHQAEIYTTVLQPGTVISCAGGGLGDLAPAPDGDGVINIADVVRALRIVVGLDFATPDALVRGDVAPGVRSGNVHRVVGDGVIDIGDVVVLLQAATGQVVLVR